MNVVIHPHARDRMVERGATERDVLLTIRGGEQFPAKYGRIGYRRNFSFASEWRGKKYQTKQVEVYTVKEEDTLVVITVIVRYF